MRLLVRTWNVFHGRSVPESGRLHLERMVRLVVEDEPDVVCLQELPVWALPRLASWSGMSAAGAVTMPPVGGLLARRLTEVDPRRLRSALTGQANAILVRRGLAVTERRRIPLNPGARRLREARRLRLPARAGLVGTLNRRIAQLARVGTEGWAVLVANLHLTHVDPRLAEAELAAAVELAAGAAGPRVPVVLCGDLNLTADASETLRSLTERGFSVPGPGIDHVLVRGAELVEGPAAWPEERRRHGRVLLSDHAPVEAEMIVP